MIEMDEGPWELEGKAELGVRKDLGRIQVS